MAVRVWGEDIPSEPESFDGEEEEGEVTPPPPSPPHETLPLFGDIISRHAGVEISVHQPKRTQTETGSLATLPPQPLHRACFDRTNSPIQDFVGPTLLVDRRGCHGHDSGIVLVESRGNENPTQLTHSAFQRVSYRYV
jgi:hypothetical protein